MKKTRFVRIALIALSVLILVGAALTGYFLATVTRRHAIVVDLEEDRSAGVRTVCFEDLSLVPGGSTEYTIKLRGMQDETYDLSFSFVASEEDEQALCRYLSVRMLLEDTVLCDQKLDTMLGADSVHTDVSFDKAREKRLTVLFYMSEEVGNEAQDAVADFALRIGANNK